MVHLIPEEMKPAADLVRRTRDTVPRELVATSRTLVKIRNSALALAVGLVGWIPLAIIGYDPHRFLRAVPGFVLLSAVIAAILWYVLQRTRRHAVDVLDMIAEERPEMTPQLAALMSMPWYAILFGPWYPAMFLPRFMARWAAKVKSSVIPRP
jgi:O-antigen ligase